MSALERRYARLVRLYPAHAPRDEILATVLQRSGEFSFREAFALLTGALRARMGANAHRGPAEFAHSAARLTALVLLVNAAVADVQATVAPLDLSPAFRTPASIGEYTIAGLVSVILHLTALAALARGAYRLAAVGAVLGLISFVAGLSQYGSPWSGPGFWAAPFAVLLIVALNLTRRRERSSSLGWLTAVLAAVILLVGAGRVLGPDWPIGEDHALLMLAALAMAWSFLDPRIPLAIAALSLCVALSDLIPPHGSLDISMVANYVVNSSLPLLLIAAAALGRRSARI